MATALIRHPIQSFRDSLLLANGLPADLASAAMREADMYGIPLWTPRPTRTLMIARIVGTREAWTATIDCFEQSIDVVEEGGTCRPSCQVTLSRNPPLQWELITEAGGKTWKLRIENAILDFSHLVPEEVPSSSRVTQDAQAAPAMAGRRWGPAAILLIAALLLGGAIVAAQRGGGCDHTRIATLLGQLRSGGGGGAAAVGTGLGEACPGAPTALVAALAARAPDLPVKTVQCLSQDFAPWNQACSGGEAGFSAHRRADPRTAALVLTERCGLSGPLKTAATTPGVNSSSLEAAVYLDGWLENAGVSSPDAAQLSASFVWIDPPAPDPPPPTTKRKKQR